MDPNKKLKKKSIETRVLKSYKTNDIIIISPIYTCNV